MNLITSRTFTEGMKERRRLEETGFSRHTEPADGTAGDWINNVKKQALASSFNKPFFINIVLGVEAVLVLEWALYCIQ